MTGSPSLIIVIVDSMSISRLVTAILALEERDLGQDLSNNCPAGTAQKIDFEMVYLLRLICTTLTHGLFAFLEPSFIKCSRDCGVASYLGPEDHGFSDPFIITIVLEFADIVSFPSTHPGFFNGCNARCKDKS